MFKYKKSKAFRVFILLISVAILINCFSGCNNKNDELEYEYYNKANAYINDKEYDKALDLVNEGIEKIGESLFLTSLKEDIEDLIENAENSDELVVPDLVGLTDYEAMSKLTEMNISCKLEIEATNEVPPRTVISTVPSAGTVLDTEKDNYVVLYIAEEPEFHTDPPVTAPSKVIAQNASFVFNEQLYPAHTQSKMGFTKNPYVENGYLVMNFWYESTDGFNWNQVATVLVENQILGASIISSDYHVESFETYYFTINVPVSGLYNPYPYYLELDFPVAGDHNMFINVTIVW